MEQEQTLSTLRQQAINHWAALPVNNTPNRGNGLLDQVVSAISGGTNQGTVWHHLPSATPVHFSAASLERTRQYWNEAIMAEYEPVLPQSNYNFLLSLKLTKGEGK